jgi:P-type E1-E2 ATPase
MTARAVVMPPDETSLRRAGHTLVFVAVDRVLLGAIAVADPMRETAVETLELLRSHGVRHIAMLTGDHDATASIVARALASMNTTRASSRRTSTLVCWRCARLTVRS